MTPLDLVMLLGGTLAKGAALLLLAGALAFVLRGAPAAIRCAVWTAAFSGLLLLPALFLFLPPLELSLDRAQASHSSPLRQVAPAGDAAGAAGRPLGPRPGPLQRNARGSEGRSPGDAARRAAPWLLLVWAGGTLVSLGLLARDTWHIRRLTRRAAPVHRGRLLLLAHRTATELGLRLPVRLALSPEIEVPVSWGLLRPVVLLPVEAPDWSAERQRVVLRHELAHVRRGDHAAHLLVELACAMHWPDPLVWLAAHRTRLEQERACDDRVIALGTPPTGYAEHLLEIARAAAHPGRTGRGVLAMAGPPLLPTRIAAVLSPRLDPRPASRATLLAVAAATFLIVVPAAAVRPWSGLGPELAAQLRSGDPTVRRTAAWTLAARGSSGARERAEALLADPDAATRGVAAWALGKQGDPRSVEPLVAALADPDAQVREMAVLALGDLGEPRAVPALAPLASDPESGVRSVVTLALGAIGGNAAAEALAVLALRDPDVHTRTMATHALSGLETPLRPVVLVDALRDTAAAVRAKAARALGGLGDPGAFPALLAALRDPSPEVRAAAAGELGELGDERALEPLIAATRDRAHEVRLTAVWALDRLKQRR